ncbi:hypothetical protein [Ureibacillus sinduriensis]|uniref:Uncharacterized protein n=1 Tax=Ureibacillus sinduriensis BLB-1 = JCM 15800 TaxID=1384057 RepID=A0A0A3HUC7_9BACL|nr:hypothetical protein [Ureibacillus sinduriensis]KGR76059.1 hypothetical protein CD33_07720 [Ureibacillus sinduriensis BLB-1 = JCM 15800]
MGNIYSAQNVAAYLIYELNGKNSFINSYSLQDLLAEIDKLWYKNFGHTAFKEETGSTSEGGYYVKEVFDAYKEFENRHLFLPAKEWHLEYGQFQLVLRPYAVPLFTAMELLLINDVLSEFHKYAAKRAS